MPPLATVADVEGRWRPLKADETIVAESLLQDASDALRLRIPDIDQQIDGGDLPANVVAGVVANVVIRVLRNPRGVRQETIGDYSYMLSETDTGRLGFLPEDWELLTPNSASGAFTIQPNYPAPRHPLDGFQ